MQTRQTWTYLTTDGDLISIRASGYREVQRRARGRLVAVWIGRPTGRDVELATEAWERETRLALDWTYPVEVVRGTQIETVRVAC